MAKTELEMVQAAIQTLVEHFDTCQIFCSRHDPAEEDGTVAIEAGFGNQFARRGQVAEWVLKQDAEIMGDSDD